MFSLIFFYFISLSISSINTLNILDYLASYKNYIFSILLFFSFYYLCNSKIKLIIFTRWLLISSFFWILLHLVLYFDVISIAFITLFFHEKYINLYVVHAYNKKFFFETHYISFLPIWLAYLTRRPNRINKILFLSSLLSIAFLSYVSNFRITFLVLIVTLLLFFFLLLPQLKKEGVFTVNNLITGLIGLIVTLLIANAYSLAKVDDTTINRLITPNIEASSTITTRLDLVKEAFTIGRSYFISGVGLGNYAYYLPGSITQNILGTERDLKIFREMTLSDPHNIFLKTFAETGLLGSFSFILLLGYFLFQDISSWKKNGIFIKCYITVFWSHFVYSIFNPSFSLTYLSFFWTIRGILAGLNRY